MMRIVRVITRLDVHGGAELSTLIEAEELAARGHRVGVVTVAEPATPAAVERLEAAGIEHRHLAGSVARQANDLRRMIRSDPPDLIHAVIWAAEVVVALATFGSRVPTVVSLVNMQYDPAAVSQAPSPRRLEILRRLEGVVLRRGFDRFHCLTDAGAEHAVEHLGVDRDRITVIPRGRRIKDLAVRPDAVSELRSHVAPDGASLLVNVGRHELQKGQDLLIQVVEHLRVGPMELRVAVAGREGNQTPALRDQLHRTGLEREVSLLGARTDVAELLAAADVVCVTSRWEGLGGSVIEALGAGAPVVGFAVPAVREVVGDAGLLVEPFDTMAFASAVRELLEDRARRDELGARATARFAQRFEIGAVVDRIEAFYRAALDER